MIRTAVKTDAAVIADIYNYYIENTIVTFETSPIDGDEIARRMEKVCDSGHHWLVAEDAGRIAGYAYSSLWAQRAAYRSTAEISVYLRSGEEGKGRGTQLLAALFDKLRSGSTHAVLGGVALPNPASVALHEKFGMEKVAHFREVGYKFDTWIDVAYWQLVLKDQW